MNLPLHHDRLAQLVMKTDQTLGLDTARITLERAALVISVEDNLLAQSWAQAALLTIAECATRSFRGGVYIDGEFDTAVSVGNWRPFPISRMLQSVGCRTDNIPAHAVQIHIGLSSPRHHQKKILHCWTDGWVAAVGPTGPQGELAPGNELSGALAGAMAVSEAFRMQALGDILAGKRTQRLSPLKPHLLQAEGTDLTLLPSAIWLLGLGNLGQAALWVFGLLPYADPGDVQFVLQDLDISAPENQAIQILTQLHHIGSKKTRAMGAWAEAHGFKTILSEIPFGPNTVRDSDMPGLALIGVDNIRTRRYAARAEAGFDLVLDAGLGSTPTEVFDIRIHAFPGTRSIEMAWPEVPESRGLELTPDLVKLVDQGRISQCGAFDIAGQSVGIPGTAVAAATMQIAQAISAIRERRLCDLIDVSLANTSRAVANEAAFLQARRLRFTEAKGTR